ncbi:MAG: GHKL domain-containing protein [Bdellovibrionales bacterium]|nr:GHKL domain-containing protein [Oligoflexia bacterium]
MIAALPPNENERLANLLDYQILDTSPERGFDDLAKLAGAIAEVPISLISLVDENRQWFKAKIGFAQTSTPRDFSFCSHAILTNEPTLVNDATQDVRFSDHPFVTQGPRIRFYAGFPLVSREGHALGTLCVLDQVPRELTSTQINTLTLLARQAVALMERNRAEAILNKQNLLMARSSKLMALGQMTAEIVHEINNPLSIIYARATILASAAKKNTLTADAALESAEVMLETSKRINRIIQSLSVCLRNSDQEAFEEVSFKNWVDDTLSFCLHRFESLKIDLRVEAPEAEILLRCRPVALSQVLLNLLNNAIDAVESLSEKWVSLSLEQSDDKTVLRVSDSGRGIAVNDQKRIFEPFYTTKQGDKGRGTGLGLSISKQIVEAHGGSLQYDLNSGHTAFVASFPTRLAHD